LSIRQEHPDVDVSKTKTKVELPKPPTPFSLFTAQRRDELITKEKKSKSEALEICRDEYKEMPDDTKIQWILKAKEEEPKYLVCFFFSLMLHESVHFCIYKFSNQHIAFRLI
jgi:hypothetical protein